MSSSGPLADIEVGYRAELVDHGYKPRTVTTLVGLTRRLGCWMESGGYAVGDLCSAMAEEFLAGDRAGGRAFQPTLATLGSRFDYLRRAGAMPAGVASTPATSIDVTVDAFRRYLEIERGLVPDTVDTYARAASTLLSWLRQQGRVDLAELNARDVVGFVTEVCPGPAWTDTELHSGDLIVFSATRAGWPTTACRSCCPPPASPTSGSPRAG
jgi:hypothetical protein